MLNALLATPLALVATGARVRRDQAGEAAPGPAAADATVPASAARSSAG
jgi:hypothetical protein